MSTILLLLGRLVNLPAPHRTCALSFSRLLLPSTGVVANRDLVRTAPAGFVWKAGPTKPFVPAAENPLPGRNVGAEARPWSAAVGRPGGLNDGHAEHSESPRPAAGVREAVGGRRVRLDSGPGTGVLILVGAPVGEPCPGFRHFPVRS